MNFLEHLLTFITDRSRRLSTRATAGILVLVLVLLIDNMLGFSFYFKTHRQLEQLQSISVLLKDSSLTKDTKVRLRILEKEMLFRKNLVDHSLSFLQNISWTSSKVSQNAKNNNANPVSTRNDVLFLLSTSGLYILMGIIAVPGLLITDRETPFLKLLASMTMSVLIILLISWFYYWLFDFLIPDQVFGSWTWNYVINVLLQFGISGGIALVSKFLKTKGED